MAKPDYNFVDGTFRFFKVFGRRPGSMFGLAIWTIVLYAALISIAVMAFWPFIALAIEAGTTGQDPSDEEFLSVFASAGLGLILTMIGSLVAVLMVQGAWLRLLTHGRTAPVIPFRFGADELRLLGVNLCFIAFALFGYMVVLLVFVVVAGGVGLAAADSGAGAALGGAMGVLLSLAMLAIAVFVMLRFAAAPAMTVNEGRFRLFESFAATKGIWGWMLLSYIVIFMIVIFLSGFVYTLQVGVAMFGVAELIPMLDSMDAAPDPQRVFEIMAQPSALIVIAIIILLQALFQIFYDAAFHSVGAYAAVRHAGGEGEDDDSSAPASSVGDAPSEG